MNALKYFSNHLITTKKQKKINVEVTKNQDLLGPSKEVSNKYTSHSENDCVGEVDQQYDHSSSHLKESDQNQERKNSVPKKPKALRSILKEKIASILWALLLFLPYYLIIKPLMSLWFVFTFPLSVIERRVKHTDKRNRGSNASENELPVSSSNINDSSEKTNPKNCNLNTIPEAVEDDLNASDEIILQRDNVKGSLLRAQSVKSRPRSYSKSELSLSNHSSSNTVFGTKRMGRFLFPKKLIPKSVLNTQKKKKLVIDLDETLIHSASRSTTHSNSSQGHLVEVKFGLSGIRTLYFIHKRPYCDLFLTKVSKWYDLIIFTASMKEYADPVIDWLESSFPSSFSKRYYRSDCVLRDGVGYIKDLSIVKDSEENGKGNSSSLDDVIIIDNSPVSYAMNVDNAIQVEGWISDPTDTDLLNLLPFLEAMRYSTDVRNILTLKHGEKAFNIN
ncbi:Nuclear envelope morphology protein 1 [Saccharomyces cerevisiae]|nr:Nem1p [Saccharomyces cerevisiae YJM1388]AJU18099.1 Nem1p [Saccharomyces cerevisiae YJM1389]AJU22091.1 Nem1p [Saccharomyces cerevisiae YJM1460]AJU25154.1 Nem1p [Saccharomyces cerevisiae YJM1592]AJV26789.1 Nem1p [Saccharomyces cerevisiae YJM1083]CAI4507873.1 CLN_G0023580.mRNA.1.CDS.1 [Saccharomyces cerevisiae]